MTIGRHNHPDDLPQIFGPLKIISRGNENNLIARPQADALENGANGAPEEHEVSVHKQPQLLTTKEVKAAYQTNNWSKIKEYEKNAEDSLKSIYENISTKDEDAWTKVQSSKGDEYYMAWNDKAVVWAFTESMKPVNDAQKLEREVGDSLTRPTEVGDSLTHPPALSTVGESTTPRISYQAIVQFGIYVKSNSILGLHSYNLGLGSMIGTSFVALLIARTLSTFIADRLGFSAANFAARMTSLAVRLGVRQCIFRVLARALVFLGSCILFTLVFIGLTYLWNWLNRLYSIKVQLFNWDDNDWTVGLHKESNAVIPGETSVKENFNIVIPKMSKAGSVVTPPDFGPIKVLDSVCYYAMIVYQNDSTFMEGCDAAFQVSCSNPHDSQNKGFTYGFSVPRFKDNKHAISNGIHDCNSFFKDESQWKSQKSVETNYFGKVVNATFKDLSGAEDNTYDVIININKTN